jgi:hypothetical protein
MDRLTGRDVVALRRAVRDAATPWAELMAAVRALGRVGEVEQEHATQALLGRDFPMSLAEQTAEAIADYAAPHREALAERLRGSATVTGVFDEDRIWAAEALAALGPEYRGEAVAALCGAIADPQSGQLAPARAVQLRWTAAVALAQMDPALRDEAADVVRREDLMNDGWENEVARAEHLHDIGGAYSEEASRMLLALREEVDEEFAVDVDEAFNRISGVSPAEPAGAATADPLSAEESAAQLRARLAAGQGERGTVFVAFSDAVADSMWTVLRPVELGSVNATCRELSRTPRVGQDGPDRGASAEEHVVELNPKQRYHRPVTVRYRYHPELNAILVLTLLIGT